MAERIDHAPLWNPEPPKNMVHNDELSCKKPMTNQDFKKLMMTPRAPQGLMLPRALKQVHNHAVPRTKIALKGPETDAKAEKKKKEQMDNAPMNWQQQYMLPELHTKYKDRASERRLRDKADKKNEDASSSGGSNSPAESAKFDCDAAQSRRRKIEDSKYLGGEVERTHLVKGLDYMLLEKVRRENTSKGNEATPSAKVEDRNKQEDLQFASNLGKKIYQAVFENKCPERNVFFEPNRMAYAFNMDDEDEQGDIPITLLRSRVDCPAFKHMSASDMVIHKLTETLSYLRQGLTTTHQRDDRKEISRAAEGKKVEHKASDDSIYGDIGDYVPSLEKETVKSATEQRKEKSYFMKPNGEREERKSAAEEKEQRKIDWPVGQTVEREAIPSHAKKISFRSTTNTDSHGSKSKPTGYQENDTPKCYAECYPGAPEYDDAAADSDDESSYSKRDFRSPNSVDNPNSRKNKSRSSDKNDTAKLDRELKKINQIIGRRKFTEVYDCEMPQPAHKRFKY